ncbi:hypothetical protein H7R52_12845 [Weissella confusa]|uniref:Uncharacterized protein n=1 Tax=Weissella confusa TaxID=1583 RepID=A0A923NKF6_WEICO|nr:hypothetical protein [Weissella confusa]
MRYSNGNYEAFAHPRKPADADKKSAHIVGGGLITNRRTRQGTINEKRAN